MDFDPVDVFKDQLAGVDLTIVDFEMENEVFQDLQSSEELDLSQFVDVDLKQLCDKLGIGEKDSIVAEFGN